MVGMLEKMAAAAEAAASETSNFPIRPIPLDLLDFDPTQPRQDFYPVDGQISEAAQQALQELADDIKAHDLLQPITVEEKDNGRYSIIIGERRTRAFLLLGRKEIPATVRSALPNEQRMLMQLSENIQRENLRDIDTAMFIRRMIQGGMSQNKIAKKLNKSPAWVTFMMKFSEPALYAKWVAPGYVDQPWMVYEITRLPEEEQDRLFEMLTIRKTKLESNELKDLVRRVADEKRAEEDRQRQQEERQRQEEEERQRAQQSATEQAENDAFGATGAGQQEPGQNLGASLMSGAGSGLPSPDAVSQALQEMAEGGKIVKNGNRAESAGNTFGQASQPSHQVGTGTGAFSTSGKEVQDGGFGTPSIEGISKSVMSGLHGKTQLFLTVHQLGNLAKKVSLDTDETVEIHMPEAVLRAWLASLGVPHAEAMPLAALGPELAKQIRS